jgi:hypothetical protein
MGARMLGREKVMAQLLKIPQLVQDEVAAQLRREADDLVAAIKRAAPTEDRADPTHELRDSVHAYDNPDRPLSVRILADAKDSAGKFIGSNVEAGHRNRDGSHTPARPFFFPTYRARKKGIRRRLQAAARKPLKILFPR